jgi:hypothetical protein
MKPNEMGHPVLQPQHKVTFPVSIGEMKLFDEVTYIDTESPEHVFVCSVL